MWTKAKSNTLPDGDPVKYMAYNEHRKILCKTMKLAKKSFYGKNLKILRQTLRKHGA